MATPLVVDENVRMEILRVKRNAENNPIPFEVLLQRTPLGGDPRFHLFIPFGFKVVYTHEMQHGDIECRHLSMSLDKPGRVPNPVAVQMIAEEFGFVNKLIDIDSPNDINTPDHLWWWGEEIQGGKLIAINILEPLDGNYNRLRRKDDENNTSQEGGK